MNADLYQQVCKIGALVHRQGFVAANDGNISARINTDEFVITPTNVSKSELTPETLVRVYPDRYEGTMKPSSEYKMHRSIYANREDARAVIHVHSPYATAFAMVGRGMDELLFPEVVITLGKIPLVPYRTPSTRAFAELVGEYAVSADAMLLERHGVVTLGPDLMDAYYKLERVEHICKIMSIIHEIGRIKPLSEREISELIKAYDVPDQIRKRIS